MVQGKRRLLALVAAIVAAVFAASVVLPAGAHIRGARHNWRKHYKPRANFRYFSKPRLRRPGTINRRRNPVHWTKLKRVPAGFADGVDDTGGTADDVDCTGCVENADIAAGAVSFPKLAFDPATQSELDSLGADDGAVNQSGDPLHWTKLRGVPVGFADGIDNTGGTASDVNCTGCVHTADIAAGAVSLPKLAFDPATQSELDVLGADDGAVNQSGDPLHWTKLRGVPAGFADGVDDTGGTASDVNCTECVDTADIANGAVSIPKLAFDPATQGELDAHKGSGDHDGRYFTESELQDPGTINATTNPVHWTKLLGVPAGFADGVDDTGLTEAQADLRYWRLAGNAGTDPATQFLGTTDTAALNFRVNDARAFRLEPNATSPNVIGGFSANAVTAGVAGATIGGGGIGGAANSVSANFGTIGGGFGNTASGDRSTVGGGDNNTASGFRSTVAGGDHNTASGLQSTVAGGGENTASGSAATVAGGFFNTASGDQSFAAGSRARANHQGAFVWADSQFVDMASTANNQFIARAFGHFFLQSDSTLDDQGGFINTSTGAHLTTGGAWTNASDRDAKGGFRPVDPAEVLEGVAELPITTWTYRAEDDSVRHLGPTGQDFRAAFGLGENDRSIATVDADGVALAAIQGLKEVVEDQRAEIDALKEDISGRHSGRSSGMPLDGPVLLLAGLALGLVLAGGVGLGRRLALQP